MYVYTYRHVVFVGRNKNYTFCGCFFYYFDCNYQLVSHDSQQMCSQSKTLKKKQNVR